MKLALKIFKLYVIFLFQWIWIVTSATAESIGFQFLLKRLVALTTLLTIDLKSVQKLLTKSKLLS